MARRGKFQPFDTSPGDISKDRRLHVANELTQPIYALPSPSMSAALVDVGISTGSVARSHSGGAPRSASGVKSAFSNLNDIQKLVNLLKFRRLAGRASSDVQEMVSERRDLGDFLKANARLVRPGEAQEVLKVDLSPLSVLSWSGLGALLHWKVISLFLATEDLQKFVFFDCAPNDAWIFRHGGVVRARRNSLWEPNPNEGFVYVSRGDRLPSGTWLEPGDSLTSPNGKYVFVYQHDGNAVVYDVSDLAKHTPIWASNTGGASAWRLEVQSTGKVVVWSAEGKEAWSDPRSKTREATHYWNCSLIMNDDGILRVIGGNGGWGWATNWKG